MNILLIISLALPALISILERFVNKEKASVKWTLTTLTVLGIGVAYLLTKDNAVENNALKNGTKKTEQILQEAQAKIAEQAKTINDGFVNLQTQIAGIDNAAVLSAVKNLESKVTQFTSDSKTYLDSAVESSAATIASARKATGVVINNEYFKVPVEERNTILFDTKNAFTVVDAKDNWVTLRMNGYDQRYFPGEQHPITTDKGKVRTFVYKGMEDGRFVFYMHD